MKKNKLKERYFRELRKKLGLSVNELAELAGRVPASIYCYENNMASLSKKKRPQHNPSLLVFLILLKAAELEHNSGIIELLDFINLDACLKELGADVKRLNKRIARILKQTF